MPIYEIRHATPLSTSQRDELAHAITTTHSQKFTTPKLFVNVEFIDVSTAHTYIGGKPATANHIRAHVRTGPSRTQEDWAELCKSVEKAWYDIAGTPLPRTKGKVETDTSLRSMIVMGGLISGIEAGFVLPPAGGDLLWLRENWEAFQRKADGGDQEFKEMVEEVRERGLLDGEDGLKTAQQRLEEMLGWGDSA